MHALEKPKIEKLPDVHDLQQKRKQWLIWLALLVGVCAIVSGTYWQLVGSRHVTTDNAYAAVDAAQVTPSTGGIVKAVKVVDTQSVKAGDELVLLDETDAKIALLKAEANMARASTEFERAKTNLERRKKLALSGYVSTEELSNFDNAYKIASANYALAKADIEQAQLDLSRTIIRAPVDGVVAKRAVQLGQRVAPGAALLSIIPISQMYVNANFKEVQLKKVKIGQPVTVHADIYGSSVTYHGRVAGVSGGTGAAFAIIPAQNASGNWIKVVQRLPIRIELDKESLAEHPLRVGLSMKVDIYTGE